MSRNKGFTLVEILIVLLILGLTFASLSLILTRGTDSGLTLVRDSEEFKREVTLFWDLQRKILGAKRIKIEDNAIFMHTTGGSHFRGVVKCAYFVENGVLKYYEFPYPYGEIDELYEGITYELGKVDSFEVYASDGRVDESAYDGLPRYVKVILNGREFVFETFGK
jgi:prepilin-type N-terminal cleavage/methylation domain-containing protein